MNIQEFNEVKNMSYRQYCKYLQEKYGFAPDAYYKISPKDGHLIKSSKISRGNEGLQCHHICEDITPSLSDKDVASNNSIEYQAIKNLCYCNLLEHLFLHILITEQSEKISVEEENMSLGDGGVKWISIAINTVLARGKFSIDNGYEGYDHYDDNGIITDNKDVYLALVNRYCTSPFVRQKFNLFPEDICMNTFFNMCKSVLDKEETLYKEIFNSAIDTKLFDWNVNCFADLVNALKTNRTALVNICTGGGKTTTALEYLRVFGDNKKALVLGPKDVVGGSWKPTDTEDNDVLDDTTIKNKSSLEANTDYLNYQSFMNSYKMTNFDKYSIVICDEAHHLTDKAKRWSEGVRYILNNTNLKIIGLTATPDDSQYNGTDGIFDKRICYGLDIVTGLENGTIHKFSYISSLYELEPTREEFESHGQYGTELWKKLNLEINMPKIETVLKDNMPSGVRKIIVFAQSIQDESLAQDCMIKYNNKYSSKEYMRTIDSNKDGKDNEEAIKWFNDTHDHDACLVTVGMVSEGAHYDGINTLIMFRRTESSKLYLQQLGRIVVTKKKPNPNGIVFDFSNVAQHLIYNKSKNLNLLDVKDDEKRHNIIEALHRTLERIAGNEIIVHNYAENAEELLAELKESNDNQLVSNKIATEFLLDEDFELEGWDEFKSKIGDKKTRTPSRPSNTHTRGEIDRAVRETYGGTVNSHMIEASKKEKLKEAFKIACARLYNFEAITFKNDSKCSVLIMDDNKFDKIVINVGFPNAKVFKDKLLDSKNGLSVLAFKFAYSFTESN